MAQKNKIRFKLVSNILILLFIAVISTGYLVYKISEYELVKETKLKLLAVNNSKANAIASHFSESFRTIDKLDKFEFKQNITKYIRNKGREKDEGSIKIATNIKQHLKDQLETIKSEHNFHNIGIIEINGTPLITEEQFLGLKPKISKNGNIYKAALNEMIFTNTYESKKRKYITIISPIKHLVSSDKSDKKYTKTIALISIEIALEPIYHILNDNTGIGEKGESILVSQTKNKHTGKYKHTFLSPPKAFPELVTQSTQSKGYKTEAIQQCFKEKNTGVISDAIDYKGSKTFASWHYISKFKWGVITFVPTDTSKKMLTELASMVKILILAILILTSIIITTIISRFTKPLSQIRDYINNINTGNKPHKVSSYGANEISEITQNLETLVSKRSNYNDFAKNMAQGKLDIKLDYSNKNKDELATNLTKVRDRLDEINNENKRRKWASEGFNIHADIIMEKSGDLTILGQKLISSIVNYLQAHQGAIFTLKEVKNDRFENDNTKNVSAFELVASYAFAPERKNMTKLFHLGQGLVGQCALEKKTLHLENTPLVQSKIESGLGDSPASNLLLIPLKINEEVLGILEIGSFKKFKSFEINFLEQLGESIASSLLTLISNERTKDILKDNQHVLTLLKQKEKEVLKNQSNLVDLLENLQDDYSNSLQEIHKLKKDNQELRKRIQ